MAKVSAAFDAEGSWSELLCTTFTDISCCVLLLAHILDHATAENQILTPALERNIRQLDLAHMLGGCNLFGEAVERRSSVHNHRYSSRRLSALALTRCAPRSRGVLHKITRNTLRHHSQSTPTRIQAAAAASVVGTCICIPSRKTHKPRTPDRTDHSRPNHHQQIRDPASILEPAWRLFNAFALKRTGGRLHKWNSWTWFFYCMQFLGFWRGYTMDYPQGQRGERDEFALAHYLFISRSRRPSRLTGRGWG